MTKNTTRRTTGKALSYLLALAMVITLAAIATPAASAAPTRTGALHLTTTLIFYDDGNSGGTKNPTAENITDSTEGWKWYLTAADGYAAKTLVLNGLDLEFSGSGATALLLPDGAKIIVEGNSSVKSTNNDAIGCAGSLTIGGTAQLTVTAGGTGKGISANDDVTITGGKFNIITTSGSNNHGVYAQDGNITITGVELNINNDAAGIKAENGNVTIGAAAELTITTSFIGIQAGNDVTIGAAAVLNVIAGLVGIEANNITINGGTVEIAADEGMAAGNVTISGGTVKIEADDEGINAYGGDVTISGGAVEITSESVGILAYSIAITGGSGTVETSDSTGDYAAVMAGDGSAAGDITLGANVTVIGFDGSAYTTASRIGTFEDANNDTYATFVNAASDEPLVNIKFTTAGGGGGGGGGGGSAPALPPFTSAKTDPEEKVVDVFYMGLLGRDPDPEGFAFWVEKIEDGTMTFAEVAFAIIFSDEVKAQNLTDEQFITRLYNGLLGRSPDQDGLDFWVTRLGAGADPVAVFNEFAASPEFATRMAALGLAV